MLEIKRADSQRADSLGIRACRNVQRSGYGDHSHAGLSRFGIGGPHQHSFHTWHQLDVENGERRFYKGACRADPQHDEAVRQISL